MKSHASMNRIYRLVWNAALSLWVAVAENAKGRGKGGSARGSVLFASAPEGAVDGDGGFLLSRTCRAALVLVTSMALLTQQAHAANAADASVTAGAAAVSTAGNTTTIHQTTQRAAIDWTSLSTAAQEALIFNQPNAQAIALNRITGNSPSELLGSLTANGQVFILNPNGVLFGAGSQVNVGGLVASTLNMSNADFMAGNNVFTGSGGSGSVVNQGGLTAGQGGYLALLAPEVRNEGVMTASLGTALLAAGNKVTLNLDNGSLLGYSIDQGAINALAENRQLIKADGGQVLLGAKALDSLTMGTVNNTGVIEAKTIANKAGRIMLIGDMEHGMVNIGGTLDASAPDGGDGGFIETSAANFKILPGFRANTRAPQGKNGSWLLDPATMTIAAGNGAAANTIYEDTLEAAGSDMTIQATDSINVTGNFSNADVEMPSGLNLIIQTTGPTGTGIDLTGSGDGTALTFKVSGGGSINLNTASATQAIKSSGLAVTGGNGTITVNSAGALDISNAVVRSSGGAISLTGAGQAGNSGVLVSQSTVNAGTGTLNINGITTDSAQYGVLLDRATLTSGNANINSASSAIKLAGSSLTSSANIAIDASNATTTHHAVELVNAGATQTNVRVNGGGTINITGNLKSGGGSATGGSAGGVVITDSTVTGGTGAVTVNGDVSLPILAGQVSRGVRLDSLAKITGGGAIDITGRLFFGLLTGSAGVELGTGSEVSSTGGNVTATGRGTSANGVVTESYGLIARGKVQSGTLRGITLDGSSNLGAAGISGSGVLIDAGADIIAGRQGFSSTGIFSVSGGGTPTINGISMVGGSISSSGPVTMIGSLGGVTSMGGGHAVSLTGGSINSNTAAMTLRGMNFPAGAIAPAGSYALNIDGTSITSGGGAITLLGDRINIGSAVDAGAGKVVVSADFLNNSRSITLGGASETAAMNLSNAELNRITASVIEIGSTLNTGGISIGDTGGAINLASAPSLSLLNSNAAGTGISQTAALTVANLKADALSVVLTEQFNQISQVSGRAYGTNNFQIRSNSALSVGTVDGTAGITHSGNGLVALYSSGTLSQTQAIVASALQATSFGGMTLTNAGNQIQSFGDLTNSTSGNLALRNTAANASFLNTLFSAGRVDIANTGNIFFGGSTLSTSSNATGTAAGTAGFSVVATGGISAQTVSPNISASSGGSVYLEAGNGSIGASTAARVSISTAASVTAVANGAGSQVNLSLTGGASLENISAPGAVNVTAAGGNLAVKTVSGSSVTLSAAAGAITDANGAANNITATTLNATARDGITLGTNVTGLQTLATTGATGDISIAAANAVNTSNFGITTDAGSAQTFSLASSAGITVDSAFGNAQDRLKLTTAAGDIAINGALTASELTLNTAGNSTQTAAITATGLELLGTGTHTLNHAGNAVTTLAGNTGNAEYSQAGALAVGTVNTAGLTTTGKVLVRTTGAASDLTLNNGVASGSAANDSLVLAAGRNFVNNAGAGALDPGAGRFLVYSSTPTANTMGGLVSTGNAFGRTFAANAPTDASMTSITGNRFVYSVVPTLNVSGDNQSKAYGGADPVLTYTVGAGLVAGDTAAGALNGALSAPTGAATTGPTHAITQGTLASALGYNVAYTNGTLTVTGAPPPVPAPAPSPTPSTPAPASLFGVTAALDGAYVTAINTVAGTDKDLGGDIDGESTVSSDAALIKALNDAAAEAAGQSGGE